MGTSPYSPKDIRILAMESPGGPGRKTWLTQERSIRGVDLHGHQFRVDDSWDRPTCSMVPMTPWTGRTLFLVDKAHTDRWGTDQLRQIIEAANLRECRVRITIQAEYVNEDFSSVEIQEARFAVAPPGNSGKELLQSLAAKTRFVRVPVIWVVPRCNSPLVSHVLCKATDCMCP